MFEWLRRDLFPTPGEVLTDVFLYFLLPLAALIIIIVGVPFLFEHLSDYLSERNSWRKVELRAEKRQQRAKARAERKNQKMQLRAEKERLKLLRKNQSVERTEKHIIEHQMFTGKCPQCGSAIEETFMICPYCGKALISSSNMKTEITEKRSYIEERK